jgi:general secretion pathway protein L
MTLVVFLPSEGEGAARRLRIEGGVVAARGALQPAAGETVVAIAPAADVALHWAEVPARSAAQALAAARLLVGDVVLGGAAEQHVAVGAPEANGERPIAVVKPARIAGWLAALAGEGIDTAAIVPAALLLPRPETGYVRADLGGEVVLRGATSGFAEEAGLTELILGDAPVETIEREAIEAALVAAVANPPLDLRQGTFARREKLDFDWRQAKRALWLIAATLVVTLALNLVLILRYNLEAAELEHRADVLAATGLPRGETVNDAQRQLTARLAGLRGAGLGFTQTAASAFAAVRAVPGSELRALSFDQQGVLRMTLVTQTEGQITDVLLRLRALGLTVTPGPFAGSAGRYQGELTVAPR